VEEKKELQKEECKVDPKWKWHVLGERECRMSKKSDKCGG
jgi:hypothetical protein